MNNSCEATIANTSTYIYYSEIRVISDERGKSESERSGMYVKTYENTKREREHKNGRYKEK